MRRPAIVVNDNSAIALCHIKLHSTVGQKSNRKKGRLELRKATQVEQRRQKIIAQLILFGGVALCLWGIILFDKTFITAQTQILITLIGAIIGILVIHFFWRQKNYALFVTLFYGIFLGGSVPYCFLATTNYYFRGNEKQNLRLSIIKTGNRSGRKSSCRTPYAVVEFQNITKEIPFECDYEASISSFKNLTLTVSKGYWGYMVYTDKTLNH